MDSHFLLEQGFINLFKRTSEKKNQIKRLHG